MSEKLEGICGVCGKSRIECRKSGTFPVNINSCHIMKGTGTFDNPYWCLTSNQFAVKCPVCIKMLPLGGLGYNLNRGVEHDPINHPSHYTDGGIETIDFIEAKKLNYNCGNATKYISRAGKKDKAERAVDIAKAIWYLERELSTLKGK
jgi:hypothetical protein